MLSEPQIIERAARTTAAERRAADTARGAKLLDRILPGWHKQINLETLKMRDGSLCMMGQLFGSDIESQLAREMYPEEMESASALYHGHANGYEKALSIGSLSVVERAMEKRGLGVHEKENYEALRYVCNGQDTRCEWANEIANRRAKDAEMEAV